jgi:hypothetical protein
MKLFKEYMLIGFLLLALLLTGYGVGLGFERLVCINNPDTLPYSRPHLDWVREEDGKRCVGWIYPEMGAYFVLCDREAPFVAPIHEAHRMLPEGKTPTPQNNDLQL